MHMYVYCRTIHNSKDLEPTKMPINDRLDKESVARIHHGILCSHKKKEFMSSAGTWKKLEIILSKLTQEQKMKHCIFSLIGGWWKMRTHGPRKGITKHWGLLGEKGRASGRGRWGGIAWGEMPNVGEGEKANKTYCHVCTYATVLHVLHMYPKT